MVDEQVTGGVSGTEVAAERGPAVLEDPPITGDAVVDDAVALLTEVSAVPLDDHPAIYEGVQRTLTDRLADVEG